MSNDNAFSTSIQVDLNAMTLAFTLPLALQPITALVLHLINKLQCLDSQNNKRRQVKVLINMYKIIAEFICLLLLLPCIFDIIIRFDNTNITSDWNLFSYILIQWSFALTNAIYIFEGLVLSIRTVGKHTFKQDFSHWLHHFLHVLVSSYWFLWGNPTYYELRMCAVYAFWTYASTIPLGTAILIYFLTNSYQIKYNVLYVYLVHIFLLLVI